MKGYWIGLNNSWKFQTHRQESMQCWNVSNVNKCYNDFYIEIEKVSYQLNSSIETAINQTWNAAQIQYSWVRLQIKTKPNKNPTKIPLKMQSIDNWWNRIRVGLINISIHDIPWTWCILVLFNIQHQLCPSSINYIINYYYTVVHYINSMMVSISFHSNY